MQWIFIFNPCAQFWSWKSCSVINVWCTLTQFCSVLSLRSVWFSFITGHISVHHHANWSITGRGHLCFRCFATLTVAHNFLFILMLREPQKLIWNAVPYFWECENSTYSKLCVLKILFTQPEETWQGWKCFLGILFALWISWRDVLHFCSALTVVSDASWIMLV